jgi:hypothetical protein
MADATQTILTVGVPTLAVLVGILVNNSGLSDLKSHMDARFEAERRVNETNFKMVLGKMDELDHRLTRLEDRFERFAR